MSESEVLKNKAEVLKIGKRPTGHEVIPLEEGR